MKLKLSNYNKKSDPKLKLIADSLLGLFAVEMIVITTLPIADNTKFWINFAIGQAVVIIKFISKLTIDPSISIEKTE